MQKVYTKIESISGNVITVLAEGVRNGDLAVVSSRHGASLANIIRLKENVVSLQVLPEGGAYLPVMK